MRISDWSSDVCSSDLRSLLGSLTGGAIGGSGDAVLDVADSATGKSEEEILAEELALGPELAGRLLGAAQMWPDAQAQRRVNLIGRRMAAQTPRSDLPRHFGGTDSPPITAVSHPGGFVMLTTSIYELLATDAARESSRHC